MNETPISKTQAAMWNVDPKIWGKDIQNDWFYDGQKIQHWYHQALIRQSEIMREMQNIQIMPKYRRIERHSIILQSHQVELTNINQFIKFCQEKGHT